MCADQWEGKGMFGHQGMFWKHHAMRPGWFGFGPARRGDMQPSILQVLLDGPKHGYEIMRTLEEKTRGMWRPSPGSIYPTLQMLEERDLIIGQDQAGKRVFTLTDKGRVEAEKTPAPESWEAMHDKLADKLELRKLMFESMFALKQIAWNGNKDELEKVKAILIQTRDQLVKLTEKTVQKNKDTK
jgi:DNA-binding PadR family transcriptional regulator